MQWIRHPLILAGGEGIPFASAMCTSSSQAYLIDEVDRSSNSSVAPV